jgi:hypothetical protein
VEPARHALERLGVRQVAIDLRAISYEGAARSMCLFARVNPTDRRAIR